jgi:hypothetical protein
MMPVKKKQQEPSELDKIRAIADEIKRHQDRMLELIGEEAALDKAAYPSLPIGVLRQDIMKHGVCPCDAMLARLNQRAIAAERSGNG